MQDRGGGPCKAIPLLAKVDDGIAPLTQGCPFLVLVPMMAKDLQSWGSLVPKQCVDGDGNPQRLVFAVKALLDTECSDKHFLMLLFWERAEGIKRALAPLRVVVEGLILRPAGEMIEADAEM